jgi:hypothetical protein
VPPGSYPLWTAAVGAATSRFKFASFITDDLNRGVLHRGPSGPGCDFGFLLGRGRGHHFDLGSVGETQAKVACFWEKTAPLKTLGFFRYLQSTYLLVQACDRPQTKGGFDGGRSRGVALKNDSKNDLA